MGASKSKEATNNEMAQTFVDEQVKSKPVVVYSKTYCPYCKTAKDILKEVGLDGFLVVELDERGDMAQIQDYLLQLTGARTVPRVFIGGKCIGGSPQLRSMKDQGKLIPALKEAGAL